jgi:hypothetical protein
MKPAAVGAANGFQGSLSSDSWDIHPRGLLVDSWRRFSIKTSPPISKPAVTDPLNLTLLELAPGRLHCRWITNDD